MQMLSFHMQTVKRTAEYIEFKYAELTSIYPAGFPHAFSADPFMTTSYFKVIDSKKDVKNPTKQLITYKPNPVPKKTGNVIKLGNANVMAWAPDNPAMAPPAPPPIQTAIMGFFKGRFTPNMAGSVTPKHADNTAERQRD